ncbi:MAG: maleylpyruvate isomerase family mycothiol-dependent enzyme [Acidimicrobiia bacterium]
MQVGVLELGSRLDLEAVEPLVVDAFVAQRRRLLATARDLADDQWTSSTRCGDWNARELVIHVLGATDACRTTLTGEHSVFGGRFDPNASPNQFVESRAGEPVETTLEQLDTAIAATADAIEGQRARTPTPQMTAVWGEEVDWRLFVTHMFWDGWIHERDLLLPLGREPEASDAENRLAAAYGFHTAAIMIGMVGMPLDTTVRLEGTGSGTYRVRADGLDVTVSVSPLAPEDGPSNGIAIAVTDALAGRGPELATVLDASPDVVDALAQVGAFLQGQAAAPPRPDR